MAVKNFRKLPSSAEEGKADAVAAAGVVLVNKNHSVDQHHPVCAINGASRLLITGAATPPRLRRGVCSRYNLPMRLALLISLCVLFAAGCSRVSPAEVVIQNGTIYTASPNLPKAEGIAVNGGKIVFVGSNSDVAAYVGGNTKVIDLAGNTAVPGFTDS